MSTATRRRLPELLLRLVVALGVVVTGFALLDGPARGDVGEAAVASAKQKQGLLGLGTMHTCAVNDNGRVECWGNNTDGQLGNGSTTTSTSPTLVVGLTGVRSVSGGAQHTCALLQNGQVRCWGLNGSGQLGNASTASSNVPVPVTGISNAVELAVGGFHACARIAGGTVKCWGQDGLGELGDGALGDFSTTPVTVTGLSDATAIAAGEFHTCAVRATGGVSCWGHNGFEQLGDGADDGGEGDSGTTNADAVGTPSAVVGLPNQATRPALAITAGYGHTCVVVSAPMHAYCWGANDYGQLGHKTAVISGTDPARMGDTPTPQLVQYDNDPSILTEDIQTLAGTQSVTAGEYHTCSRVSPGAPVPARIWCWGRNDNGQLGTDPLPGSAEDDGPEPYENSVYALELAGLNAASVTAGGYHTCALVGSGVRCWGFNFHGQLGGYAASAASPVTVTAIQGARLVRTGTDFACALLTASPAPLPSTEPPPTEGIPHCWGSNLDQRLGSGTGVARTTVRQPVDLLPAPGLQTAEDLDLGNGHACSRVTGSTSLRCWGRNTDGQTGDGSPPGPVATPVASVAGVTAYDAGGGFGVSGEQGFTCARRDNGTAACWGANGLGQLGDGTTTPSPTPVTVQYDSDPDEDDVTETDLTGVVDVATGSFHACAELSNGQVRCWGLNDHGQLGDNTTDNRPLAVLVQDDETDDDDTPLGSVQDVVAGARHSCALLTGSNGIRCWGANDVGQLGDDLSPGRSNATKQVKAQNPPPLGGLANLTNAEDISAGDTHTCAERQDKGVVCWGGNSFFQSSGSGSFYRSGVYAVLPPRKSFDGDLVTSLSASRKNTCATFIDSSVQCWGDNASGQLGDGLGTRSLAPVVVGSGPTGATPPAVGGNQIPEPLADTVEIEPGTTVDIDVLANDTDPDLPPQTLTLLSVQDVATGTATVVAGKVHYVPGPGCYDETFTYTMTDGTAPVTATVSVLMNCAPVAVDDATTANEDGSRTIDVLANDTDPESDPLTVTVTSQPAHGSAVRNPDNTVTYTPDGEFCSGPVETFTYSVTDGGTPVPDHTDTASVVVTVACSGDAPTPGLDVASTPEDTSVLIDVLFNDTDADGDDLALVSVGAPGHGTTSIEGGKVRYRPQSDYCNSVSPATKDTFTYVVGDGGTQATGTVTVTVVCQGDSPRANPDVRNVPEDGNTLIDVRANDTDPDQSPAVLTLESVEDPVHGTATKESGSVRYVPDADFCGRDVFQYVVRDPDGLAAAGTVDVTVTCTNDTPVAVTDTPTTDEDVTVHVHVLSNDSDVDGDRLRVVSASGAEHGTLSLAVTDAVAYTPAAGYCGDDAFTYVVSDSSGATAVGHVQVTVVCKNDPVVLGAVADASTPWGSPLGFTLTSTDDDGLSDTPSYSIVNGPPGATVVTATGEFSWTPGSGQVGAHSITVAVTDGDSTDTATFTVTVTRRPVALVWTGDTTGQVTDNAVVAGLLIDPGTGGPLSGRTITLSLGGTTRTVTTNASGIGTSTVTLAPPVNSRTATAAFAGNAQYLPMTTNATFTVMKEDVAVALGGQPLVTASGSSAPATLVAELTEPADGALGASLAGVQVTFRTVATPSTVLCTATATSSAPGTGRATCTTAALPVGTRAVVITASSPNYAGPADVGVVTIANTGTGFVSGAGRTGAHDMGFQARPVKKGAPTGDLVVVAPDAGGVAVYSTGTLGTLSASCSTKPRVCPLALTGTGLTKRVVDSSGTVGTSAASTSLSLWAKDIGEPTTGAAPDTWAFAVSGGPSLGSAAGQVLLDLGNVKVTP